MSDEPLVDTHVHFWDHSVVGLHWPWLEPDFEHPRLAGPDHAGRPRLADLDAQRYTGLEFLAEAGDTSVAGVVHVDATGNADDPAAETVWLQALAEEHGLPDAIVGSCQLSAPDASALLRRHARHDRFRGVRDRSWDPVGNLDDIAEAIETAAELGAVLELRAPHECFPVLAEIADHWPTVVLALSHACLPVRRESSELAAWRSGLEGLSGFVNVVCKISAVAGASDPDWTVASMRPWVLTPIEVLGAQRCMLGTNWPVDRLFGSYDALVDAYREVTAPLSPAERAAVFHGTASRVYRIPLDVKVTHI